MRLERHPGAASFLAAAESFLLDAEVENNLILGIARELLPPATEGALPPYFATVRERAHVQVCAARTLPDKLVLTRARRSAALIPLADDVRVACAGVQSIAGPEPTVAEFAELLAGLLGTRAQRRMSQRIHELRVVVAPEPRALGRLRRAREDEVDTLTGWIAQLLHVTGDRRQAGEIALERIQSGRLFVWDNGGPVAMAAWTGKTPTGVRVNFVYTPPALRGRGYATACVAGLSELLLAGGNQYCCLYTDLANPTSNAIYARLGYRPICDAALYELVT